MYLYEGTMDIGKKKAKFLLWLRLTVTVKLTTNVDCILKNHQRFLWTKNALLTYKVI